jgi:hypothetical protein
MSFIFTQIRIVMRKKTNVTLFQTFSEKKANRKRKEKKVYWTSVNLRLNPKSVMEVGKVVATNGLFIV